ncbi:unnamed protein product [Gadus morhua 'NCC']
MVSRYYYGRSIDGPPPTSISPCPAVGVPAVREPTLVSRPCPPKSSVLSCTRHHYQPWQALGPAVDPHARVPQPRVPQPRVQTRIQPRIQPRVQTRIQPRVHQPRGPAQGPSTRSLVQLHSELQSLRGDLDHMKSQHNKEIKLLMNELDEEKRVRLTLQMEVQRMKKQMSKLLDRK